MVSTLDIGPWPGGLNLTSNRYLSPYLSNDELGSALNIQYTPEGFIESRPGFKIYPSNVINTENPTITILGSVYIENQEVGVIQRRTSTAVEIYYITGNSTSYFKYSFSDTTLNFSSILVINNSEADLTDQVPRGVFLFSSSGPNQCYRLEEVPSIASPVTPTLMSPDLKVPRSNFSFAVKDRIFLVDSKDSMLYWSALTINSLWFDTTKLGTDGKPTQAALEAGFQGMDPSLDSTDDILAVEFINNSFYLFKKQSTYMFTYQAKPEEDGYMRKISSELGAFASVLFRNTIVVFNERGIFSVEGTEFIDLQTKLNLRFEYYIDVVNPKVFITDFNGHILCGYISKGKSYYFLLNGFTRGWSQWSFDYAEPVVLASPGSNAVFCRTTDDVGIIIFTTFDKTRLVYAMWKPLSTPGTPFDYALDSELVTDSTSLEYTRYIPKINIYTKAQLGDSLLNYKKIYRSYLRWYLSDMPGSNWHITINYNNYKFDPSKNPQFILETEVNDEDLSPSTKTVDTTTAVYKRTYQIPLPQQRSVEFVYELTRPFTKLVDIRLVNPNPDRAVQNGFYFMLSGLWVDYEDKARI